MSKPQRKILIVDDTKEDREALKFWLMDSTKFDYVITESTDVKGGLELYHSQVFDCVILDYSFPTETAIDFLNEVSLGNMESKSPIILVTGQGNETVAVGAMKAGAHDYITKNSRDFSQTEIHRVVDKVIRESRTARALVIMQSERDAALLRLKRSELELKQSVRELKKAKQGADSANIAKSAFLANMSHEIRSPLTAIIGFTELLQTDGLTISDQGDYLKTIHRSGKHLLSVINEVLDYSRLEANQVALNLGPIILKELLSDTVDSFKEQARAKAVTLRTFMHPRLPEIIHSDPMRLRQILTNLISNALKFTAEGEIAVIVQPEPYSGVAKQISFSVTDTGVGISKADAGKLFKRFSQANVTISAKFGGTGLGLVLSRKLARLLGGELELVSSEPGVGSLFKFTVPSQTSPPVDRVHVPSKTVLAPDLLKDCRILLADDSFDNQLLLRRVLEKSGAKVECASNGLELIDMAHTQDFDIILMDVQMPVMDGHEAARILRGEGLAKPIIGLTAHALKEDRMKSVAAGFTDQLSKPIDMNELLKTIKSLTAHAEV